MSEIKKTRYLINGIDNILYDYPKNKKIFINVINAIQKTVKEIIQKNKELEQIKYINIICECNLNTIELEKILINRKQKLKAIIELIVLSKYFKEKFEINGEIGNREIDFLVKDIEESVIFLEFEFDSDISNFIIAYIKKFIETTNM